jgi:hypothetical protein
LASIDQHTNSVCQESTEEKSLPIAASGCCETAAMNDTATTLHGDLRDLLSKYNVNEYAASVKVFAIKANSSN